MPKKTKIGHSGTLDPLATGLLIVATHRDTKSLGHLQGSPKTYRATIDLSQTSDTRDTDAYEHHTIYPYDLTASTLTIADQTLAIPTHDQIIDVTDQIQQMETLPVPYFSAKKKDGKKLYEYARAGTYIDLHVPMTIYDYTLHAYSFPLIDISYTVSGGTYIRSIAAMTGRLLGTGGLISALRRTAIGTLAL